MTEPFLPSSLNYLLSDPLKSLPVPLDCLDKNEVDIPVKPPSTVPHTQYILNTENNIRLISDVLPDGWQTHPQKMARI